MACGGDDNPAEPQSGDGDPEVHVDSGNIGLVLDTRAIFRRGYLPSEAQVSFADHPAHDAVIEFDELTNLAILSLHNDDLTEDEQSAFAVGVAATVVVTDGAGTELARVELPALMLDDSNQPLNIATTLPPPAHTASLRSDLPYLLQPEGGTGFMALSCTDCYRERPYVYDDATLQIYFTEVGGEGSGVYHVRNPNPDYPGLEWWFMLGGTWLGVRSEADGGSEEFALDPESDGYVRIRHVATGLYLYRTTSDMQLNATGDRFRIISDAIDWDIEDLGTHFNQPIMPPAQLDFAYSGRLSNCSSAILEESVGRTESRTSMTTIGTVEGLELFAGSTESYEVTHGTEVNASVGFEIGGFGASTDVTFSQDETWAQEFTTNRTTSAENNWSRETSQTIEVSRTRTVTVPEFTVVDVDDAVKTIRNVTIPFTQVLRVRGLDRRDGTPISGAEIATQITFNLATCLVTHIGADYVNVSIRGEAVVDQIMDASTLVWEIEGACN